MDRTSETLQRLERENGKADRVLRDVAGRRHPLPGGEKSMFMHHTISEDRSGSNESVTAEILSRLGEREQRYAKPIPGRNIVHAQRYYDAENTTDDSWSSHPPISLISGIKGLYGMLELRQLKLYERPDGKRAALVEITVDSELSLRENSDRRGYTQLSRRIRDCLRAYDITALTIQPTFMTATDYYHYHNGLSLALIDGLIKKATTENERKELKRQKRVLASGLGPLRGLKFEAVTRLQAERFAKRPIHLADTLRSIGQKPLHRFRKGAERIDTRLKTAGAVLRHLQKSEAAAKKGGRKLSEGPSEAGKDVSYPKLNRGKHNRHLHEAQVSFVVAGTDDGIWDNYHFDRHLSSTYPKLKQRRTCSRREGGLQDGLIGFHPSKKHSAAEKARHLEKK